MSRGNMAMHDLISLVLLFHPCPRLLASLIMASVPLPMSPQLLLLLARRSLLPPSPSATQFPYELVAKDDMIGLPWWLSPSLSPLSLSLLHEAQGSDGEKSERESQYHYFRTPISTYIYGVCQYLGLRPTNLAHIVRLCNR